MIVQAIKNVSIRSYGAAALALLLASCAAQPLAPPPMESSPLTGKLTQGTVLSVRTINLTPTDSAMIGVNAVLSGLGLPSAHQSITASELVFRRQDRGTVSLVQPPSTLQPGDRATIVEAATTTVQQY